MKIKPPSFTVIAMLILYSMLWVLSIQNSDAQIVNVPADYATIQAGINAAVEGDTVLVAEGTYYENVNFNGKAITLASHFILTGNQAQVSNTIIDGSKPANSDSASVVIMVCKDTTAVLYGFTITGGKGTKLPFFKQRVGGGVLIEGGKAEANYITKNSVEVQNDSAVSAGGISAVLTEGMGGNNIIRNNIITNNRITGNAMTQGAGLALVQDSGIAVIEGNKIYKNIATCNGTYKATGAGINLSSNTPWKPEIRVCNNEIFENENHCVASHGGGIFIVFPPFTDTYQAKEINIQIYNNIISNNYSQQLGGGISLWDREYQGKWDYPGPIIYNNTIVGNKAEMGAGIHNYDTKVLLVNNILVNDLSLGASEIYNDSLPYFGRYLSNEGIIQANYNNIQNNYPGPGNFSAPPNFKAGTFELSDSSRCVGTGVEMVELDGTEYFAPKLDFNDVNRELASNDGRIDLGAFESSYEYKAYTPYTSNHIINVPDKEPTIREAINSATNNDTILVADGLYYENINYSGKAITVASHYIMDTNEMHITNTVIDGSKPDNPDNASVVNMPCNDTTSVLSGFTITGGTGTVSNNVVRVGGGVLMDGGKLVNNIICNNNVEFGSHSGCCGGGIVAGRPPQTVHEPFNQADIIIRDNVIHSNSTYNPSTNNEAKVAGGGLYIIPQQGLTLLENNKILDNKCETRSKYKAMGGGVYIHRYINNEGEVIVRNNLISENRAISEIAQGGGLELTIWHEKEIPVKNTYFKEIQVYNNIITNNYSGAYGGGIGVWYVGYWHEPLLIMDPIIFNNTIMGNNAPESSGLSNIDGNILLYNNIFWNDLSTKETTEISHSICDHWIDAYSMDGNPAITHAFNNNIQCLASSDSTINCKPYFNTESLKFTHGSKNVGGAVESFEFGGISYYAPSADYFGNSRPNVVDEFIDLGAVESNMVKGTDCVSANIEVIENETSNYILCYPNPSQGHLTIEFLVEAKNYKLQVFDINGKQMYTHLISVIHGQNCHSIDVSNLAKGYYIIAVSDANGTQVGSQPVVVY